MRLSALFVVAFAAITSACTTYSQGVESFWQRPDVLVVAGAGNGFTSQNQIDNYVLLRAAEKAVESRYRYFVMLDSKNTGSTNVSTYNTPVRTSFNASTYGNTTNGSMTTTGGLQTMYIYNPGRDAAFRMFDVIPVSYRPGQYYDAVAVLNEFGPKYIDGFKPVVIEPNTIVAAPSPNAPATSPEVPQPTYHPPEFSRRPVNSRTSQN